MSCVWLFLWIEPKVREREAVEDLHRQKHTQPLQSVDRLMAAKAQERLFQGEGLRWVRSGGKATERGVKSGL